MKICGIICEYNPFHNGHLHLIQQAKQKTNADAIVCIMSGNFVQRGEIAVMDKYTRAKHAVLAGADAVIELPTTFATSNAELFAKGAIHILSSIPDFSYLCFGAENANKEKLLSTAKLLLNEPEEVSQKIKEQLANGVSYAKARTLAWKEYIDEEYLSSPNNILAIEYTKALLAKNCNASLVPVQRVGGGYHDETLHDNYSSATAIRNAINCKNAEILRNLPDFVAQDLPTSTDNCLTELEKLALLNKPAQEIAKVCDCSEGLENSLKRCAEQNSPNFVEELTNARYTSSRIRRIALQTLLNITSEKIVEGLQNPLYIQLLGAKKDRIDVLSTLAKSEFPLLTKYTPPEHLPSAARTLYEIDLYADKLFAIAKHTQIKKGNIFY